MSLDRHTTVPNHYDEGAQNLWSIYVNEAEQYDNVLTGTWKVDLDSTLIFAGLFSATVTAFIIESYKSLKPDPDHVTVALLAQTLAAERVMAMLNNTADLTTQVAPSEFRAPAWAIAVNVLWFLSLTSVLTAAMTITLVQQWVRDYFHRVHRYPQPFKRARMRLFLFSGIEKWRLDDIVEYIPILLHISLFLFFAGLCVFLAKINTYVVVFVGFVLFCWIVVYCIATFAPLFDFASPFETPLSSTISRLLSLITSHQEQENLCSLNAIRERKAMEPFKPAEVDAHAISWTVQRMTDDKEREKLLASIPSFLRSNEGRKTWEELVQTQQHTEIIAMFIRGTASLLDVASPLSGGQVDTHEGRVTICLDALLALLRITPHRWPPQINISPLSQPLYRLAHASYKDKVALQTKAICLHALHTHFTVPQSYPYLERLQPEIMELSLEADRGLHSVDIMRQRLEDDLEAYKNSSGTGLEVNKVSASIQAYLDAIQSSSESLAKWLRSEYEMNQAARDVLGNWSDYLIAVQKMIQSCPILRGEGLLLVSYQNTPYLKQGTWNILALLIMAYMRDTRVYPSLSILLGDNDSPVRSSDSDCLKFWFNFYKDVDERWISKAFAQELHLLASALDILDPHRESTQIGGNFMTNTSYDTRTLLKFSHSQPNLPTLGRPFSLWASIAHATMFGCQARGLSDLVCALRSTYFCGQEIQANTGPILGEILRMLKEGFRHDRSTGSLLFFFSVLHEVLSWEREGGLFPFSEENMEYLVDEIFLGSLKQLEGLILLQDSLDTVDMIVNLKEMEGDEAELPLYDLRDLYVAPTQSLAQAPPQGPPRTSHWLEKNRHYKIIDLEDKKRICSRIMEGRRQFLTSKRSTLMGQILTRLPDEFQARIDLL